jgi:hypothetical protein
MHEIERDAALGLVKDAHPTDSYVMGTLDDAGITTLRDRGLILQVLEDSKRPAFVKATAAEAPLAGGAPVTVSSAAGLEAHRRGRGTFDVLDALPEPGPVDFGLPAPGPFGAGPGGVAPEEPTPFLMSIDGPLLEDWRNRRPTEAASGRCFVRHARLARPGGRAAEPRLRDQPGRVRPGRDAGFRGAAGGLARAPEPHGDL